MNNHMNAGQEKRVATGWIDGWLTEADLPGICWQPGAVLVHDMRYPGYRTYLELPEVMATAELLAAWQELKQSRAGDYWLMNPHTGSVDLKSNWLAELGEAEFNVARLIRVARDIDGEWREDLQ